jgi:signal transduction histidine kinase
MRITHEISNQEIDDLVLDLNRLMEKHRTIENDVEKKEQALKDLVTNLSHDIRTPLTSLDGYFQLLMACEVKEDRERYYKIISGRIESLRILLDQLFMYMKLQNNSYEFEMSQCNLNKLLYDGLFEFYQEFTDRMMEPVVEIPEETITIMANYPAFSRVIQNIIKNILEHGSNRFAMHVVTVGKKVSIEFENGFLSNNAMDISKIFDRFYKADPARTSTSTGLGLAIAKELVLKMNGEINATANEDTFTITIQFDMVE